MMRHALLTTLLALLAVLTRHSSSAQGGYFPGASIKGTKGGGYYPYPPNPYPPNPYPYPYPTPSPIIPSLPMTLPFIARGTLTLIQNGYLGGGEYYQQQQIIPPIGSSMGMGGMSGMGSSAPL
nr:uncharacterized protein LOC119168041 [Rhipicephalus microplus]